MGKAFGFLLILLLAPNVSEAQVSLDDMQVVVECRSASRNPLTPKIRVFVKKSNDLRLFGQVEAIRWSGMSLKAHAEVRRKNAIEAEPLPLEFEGTGFLLRVSNSKESGSSLRQPRFKAQIAYTDLRGDSHSEAVVCILGSAFIR